MIKNKSQLKRQFSHGQVLLDLADDVLLGMQPERLVSAAVQYRSPWLAIQGRRFDLRRFRHIYVVGAGKATYGMTEAVVKILDKRITAGAINVPIAKKTYLGNVRVQRASHPFPNQATVAGTQRISDIVQSASADDLVICLVSGGGSSMLPAPVSGLSLRDKVRVTKQLMQAGATIQELNTVRKHVSAVKGGRLAQLAAPATVVSLIISDVIGNELTAIASGPTVVDTTTCDQAVAILKRYRVGTNNLRNIICRNESPKRLASNVHNFLIGSNQIALNLMTAAAKRQGIRAVVLTSQLRGEAKEVARVLLAIAQEVDQCNRPVSKPVLLLASGETTVTVLGKGQGGRNQELVLAAVPFLSKHMSIVSLATDGVDGTTPTPVAGALADGSVREQCVLDGIDYQEYLYANNSFQCLQKLGCLLRTGPTGTNVGDVVMILVK